MQKIFVFIICFLIGFGAVVSVHFFPTKKMIVIPKKVSSTFSIETPPSESIKATIATFSGSVMWESRVATQESPLGMQRVLSQGENIQTGKDGNVTIVFPSQGEIVLFPKTTLSLIQTLPSHMVFSQSGGVGTYQSMTSNSLAVSAEDLLVEQANGKMMITDQDSTNTVFVNDLQGSINVGYNDLSYNTQTDSLAKNQELVFNDTKRSERILSQ